MSICSLTDFIETSLGRCGGWVCTATVTGQGASWVDVSVRGEDFSWPKPRTSGGHQRVLQLAKTAYFFMATDTPTADTELMVYLEPATTSRSSISHFRSL